MSQKAYQLGENYQYPLLIKQLLKTPLIYSPNQEIVYRDKLRYTYKDLNRRIHQLANGLSSLGVNAGDTVAVFDYDSNRYLECFFAIPMMGAVLQTANWRLSADQIIYTINHAEARVAIVNSDFLPIVEAIRDKLTTVKKIIIIAEDGVVPKTSLSFDTVYEDMLAKSSAEYDFPDFDENTKATTFYTTGTTGDPKGVYFTHRQLVLHTLSTGIAAGAFVTPGTLRSDDVYMPITPMFHVHAWGIPFLATLLGVKQVYPGKYEPPMLLKLVVTEKVTFSHCVPTIIQMVLTSPAAKEVNLSKWKVIIGGSRLSKGLANMAKERGIEIFTGYGMSETCPILTLALPKAYMADWDSDKKTDIAIKTGIPIPLVDIEVADAEDNPLPHDGMSTGEVIVRSPWLTQSYFKSPDKTKELWQSGWLHTGDVGYIDPEGYLQITDRIKDVIKSGGEWVSSLDLENLISQHEAVLESAAIGVPDEKWGERPLMLVVLKPEFKDKVTPEDLKAFMKKAAEEGKLPKYGVPDRYEIVEMIAKTSVGKLNKKALRSSYR
ncbi:MAG: long-chain fatty acid--CoA ligase [Desulfobacteraceae bacterium IS3]|nr:MAG: long-chain fatty acid--CoA ligase [Desulfobacteraceae bacterium IS3]